MKAFYDFMYKRFKMEKDQVDQRLYEASLIAVVVVLFLVAGYMVPSVRPLMEAMRAWLVKLATILILGVLLVVLGLGFLGHLIRYLVDFGDKKRASEISLSPWIHWIIAVVSAAFFGAFWPGFVEYLVSYQTHLQVTFIQWVWLQDGILIESGKWWLLGSISFFLGYFYKSIRANI